MFIACNRSELHIDVKIIARVDCHTYFIMKGMDIDVKHYCIFVVAVVWLENGIIMLLLCIMLDK